MLTGDPLAPGQRVTCTCRRLAGRGEFICLRQATGSGAGVFSLLAGSAASTSTNTISEAALRQAISEAKTLPNREEKQMHIPNIFDTSPFGSPMTPEERRILEMSQEEIEALPEEEAAALIRGVRPEILMQATQVEEALDTATSAIAFIASIMGEQSVANLLRLMADRLEAHAAGTCGCEKHSDEEGVA